MSNVQRLPTRPDMVASSALSLLASLLHLLIAKGVVSSADALSLYGNLIIKKLDVATREKSDLEAGSAALLMILSEQLEAATQGHNSQEDVSFIKPT